MTDLMMQLIQYTSIGLLLGFAVVAFSSWGDYFMTTFTIGNIAKEVQRIQFDIENGYYKNAIDRCENLDQIFFDIEEGKHELVI